MKDEYACCDEHRRSLLCRDDVDVNGIDCIEVQDNPAQLKDKSRTILLVSFFKPLKGTKLSSSDEASACRHLKIYGGERIRDITVKSLKIFPEDERLAKLELSCQGDLSLYTLAVVRGPDDRKNSEAPLEGFDPVFYRMDFRFRPECTSSECGERLPCPPELFQEPEIDYLAKDYSSFRRLMLERMSHLLPQWKERNASDMGVALVELLAYVGDYLSYQQDAVATEVYIGTARKRISVRRHARLVDYFMHEGCNSRVFVQVRVNQDIMGTEKVPALPRRTQLLTAVTGKPKRLPRGSPVADKADAVFETLIPLESLYYSQSEMEFYTWGKDECCLPKGATKATIAGSHPELKKGAVLIFQEVLGPKSGEAVDADLSHRHAVMLSKDSLLLSDPLGNLLNESGTGPIAVTEIEWGEADALPFQLCISSVSDKAHGQRHLSRVSIALGNIVLADHGRTVKPRSDKALSGQIDQLLLEYVFRWGKVPGKDDGGLIEFLTKKFSIDWAKTAKIEKIDNGKTIKVYNEKSSLLLKLNDKNNEVSLELDDRRRCELLAKMENDELNIFFLEKTANLGLGLSSIEYLGSVPLPRLHSYPEVQAPHCSRQEPAQIRPRFNPSLDKGPVTQVATLDSSSASAMIRSGPQDALPDIVLFQAICDEGGHVSGYEDWNQRRDLISSGEEDRDFVIEVNDEGAAFIRFGDGTYGTAPEPGSMFYASYRVGNGTSGNVGAGSIDHILFDDSRITGAWNPMPAAGGTEPESIDLVRVRAPMAFRTQERAVTQEDYAEIVQRFPGVQKAVATFRWTGSWMTVFLTVDRMGGLAVDDRFKEDMIRHMERFRMAGHDLEVENPLYVSIDLTMTVCVRPEYISDQVKDALLQRFGNSILPDGRMGMFHPDNLTFGQTLYPSAIYEAALGVEGVESVQIDKFQRQDQAGDVVLKDRNITFERTEIPRLDNDPNFPDRGMLHINPLGGR